jgi:hypothetical protein
LKQNSSNHPKITPNVSTFPAVTANGAAGSVSDIPGRYDFVSVTIGTAKISNTGRITPSSTFCFLQSRQIFLSIQAATSVARHGLIFHTDNEDHNDCTAYSVRAAESNYTVVVLLFHSLLTTLHCNMSTKECRLVSLSLL